MDTIKRVLLILIFVLFANNYGKSQINIGELNKSWIFDQVYIDSARIYHAQLDSIVYTYNSDKSLKITNIYSNKETTLSWKYNSTDQILNHSNSEGSINESNKVTYLDNHHLIYIKSEYNTQLKKQIVFEYRLIPYFNN